MGMGMGMGMGVSIGLCMGICLCTVIRIAIYTLENAREDVLGISICLGMAMYGHNCMYKYRFIDMGMGMGVSIGISKRIEIALIKE